MSNASFETFLVSGLLVLIAAIVYLAWSAWRWIDRERDMEKLALGGIAHELRANLKRMLAELSGLANGSLQRDIEIVPVIHPQLDAILSRPNEADRRGLTLIRGTYNELSAHKQSLRHALAQNGDIDAAANIAADAVIGSLAMLYLWEEHKGTPPELARSTRSWDVRDWMKAQRFDNAALPGRHLRDQVVEWLRQNDMVLTPKPLSHTASEFYAMQYDRKADPNAPFWKRKAKPAALVESEASPEAEIETETIPEPIAEAPQVATPEPVAVETATEASGGPDPQPDPGAETPTAEPATEASGDAKPTPPGQVH